MDLSQHQQGSARREGMLWIPIQLSKESTARELEIAEEDIRLQVSSSHKGVLIDCERLVDVDDRILGMLLQCQRAAVTENKRFALVRMSQPMLQTIRDQSKAFPLDCFGLPSPKSKTAVRDPGRSFGWSLLSAILFPISWLMKDRPLKDPTSGTSKNGRAKLRRWAMLVTITTFTALPVLYAVSAFMDANRDDGVLAVTKTFESRAEPGPSAVVRGQVEGIVDGKRMQLNQAIIFAWREQVEGRLSTVSTRLSLPTEGGWTTRSNSQGMFVLSIPASKSQDSNQLMVAVMAPSSTRSESKSVVTELNGSRQPADRGEQWAKVFQLEISPARENRLSVLLNE